MGRSGAAAVSAGLWVLVTVGVAADPCAAAPWRCLLSHYRSLDPGALAAVKALRDRYEEETLSCRPRRCSLRPRRDPPPPSGSPRAGGEARARAALSHSRSPHSCARLRLVARGIADAQAVLSSLRGPERVPGTGPTLELLAAAARDVAACLEMVRPGSWRKSLRPPRRRPKARRAVWSRGEADSPRCHEATVIFTLLRLLTWDLRLVAHAGPCV